MKQITTLLLALITVVQGFSQTAEEIIAGYVNTIGGEEAIRKNTTWKMTAKVDVGGMELPVYILKAPNKTKIYFSVQGMNFVQQAYDGKVAWKTNQMTMEPEKLTSEETANLAIDLLEEPDIMVTYKALGYTAEKVADEKVDGADCYAIKITKKQKMSEGKPVDNITTYFIDKSSSALVMTRTVSQEATSKGVVIETLLSDYQEAGGIFVPFSMTIRTAGEAGQTIKFEKIEANVSISDSEFTF